MQRSRLLHAQMKW